MFEQLVIKEAFDSDIGKILVSDKSQIPVLVLGATSATEHVRILILGRAMVLTLE
jgi:hypothetical protein